LWFAAAWQAAVTEVEERQVGGRRTMTTGGCSRADSGTSS